MDLDLESGGVDLVPRLGGGTPSQHSLDLLCGDQLPVLVAQQVIQQHLEGERQVVHAQPVQTVQLAPAIAKHHRITGLQAVPQWWSLLQQHSRSSGARRDIRVTPGNADERRRTHPSACHRSWRR